MSVGIKRYQFFMNDTSIIPGDVILFQCEQFIISFSNGLYFICAEHKIDNEKGVNGNTFTIQTDRYTISESECNIATRFPEVGILLLTLLVNSIDRRWYSIGGSGCNDGSYCLDLTDGDWNISHLYNKSLIPVISGVGIEEAVASFIQFMNIKGALNDDELKELIPGLDFGLDG